MDRKSNQIDRKMSKYNTETLKKYKKLQSMINKRYHLSLENRNIPKPKTVITKNVIKNIDAIQISLDDEEDKRELSPFLTQDPITLNVGGIRFDTSYATLTKYKNTFFSQMICGPWRNRMKCNENKEEIFIDRDGTHFALILNFMRDGKIIVGGKHSKWQLLKNEEIVRYQLLQEASFYCIQPLISALMPNCGPNIDSEILENALQVQILEAWISAELMRNDRHVNNGDLFSSSSAITNISSNSNLRPPSFEFNLLFRASKHGFLASEFHRRCDHRGPTLVIISANNCIFGGYSPVPWNHNARAVDQIASNSRSSTFTFMLQCKSQQMLGEYQNNENIANADANAFTPEKWNYYGSSGSQYQKNPCYAVYHHHNFGPVFGYRPAFEYGNDTPAHLVIADQANTKIGSKLDCYVGEALGLGKKHTTHSFFVLDYEVFEIVKNNKD